MVLCLTDALLLQALSRVHVLVLDEGDNLLDMGFKPQLDKIIARLRPNTLSPGQQVRLKDEQAQASKANGSGA